MSFSAQLDKPSQIMIRSRGLPSLIHHVYPTCARCRIKRSSPILRPIMTDQSLVPTERQPRKPIDERRRKPVSPAVKQAIDQMVEDGSSWQDAAVNSGLTTRAMRKALETPLVLQYLRERKQMLRASISAGNIRRLGQIRDAADNMPAVQAIKLLEEMDQVERSSPGGTGQSLVPGVTIYIVSELPRVSIHADEGLPVSNPPMIALEPVKPR